MKNIELYYPGYTKKAVTFSIDDGNIQYDKKLLDILRPAGILGTFNLTSTDRLSPDDYREMYRGYEIANHCKHHPFAFSDGQEYAFSDERFDPERVDKGYIYKHPTLKNFYYISRTRGWRLITDAKTYVESIKASHLELEAVFGEGSVRSFVWPFGEQKAQAVKDYLASCGYYAVRQSGLMLDSTGFSFPSPMGWRCNANHTNLLDIMAIYEKYPDDGELKFFAFGVHSADFEFSARWDDLRAFADMYGNRPQDFFYASVGEIFDYHKAVGMLRMGENEISNPSDIPVYVTVGGDRITVPARNSVSFK